MVFEKRIFFSFIKRSSISVTNDRILIKFCMWFFILTLFIFILHPMWHNPFWTIVRFVYQPIYRRLAFLEHTACWVTFSDIFSIAFSTVFLKNNYFVKHNFYYKCFEQYFILFFMILFSQLLSIENLRGVSFSEFLGLMQLAGEQSVRSC